MKHIYLIFSFLCASRAFAENATCTLSIDTGGSKYNVEAKFTDQKAELPGQRKSFDIPGSKYSCMLTFFGLYSGTMIACNTQAVVGGDFFSSDRTSIEEANPRNNLRFQVGGKLVDIQSECK